MRRHSNRAPNRRAIGRPPCHEFKGGAMSADTMPATERGFAAAARRRLHPPARQQPVRRHDLRRRPEHHRTLCRHARGYRNHDRYCLRLWRARRLRCPPRLEIPRRSQRPLLGRHNLWLSLEPVRRAASGTRRRLADCGGSDHCRANGTGGRLAAARCDAVARRRPDRAWAGALACTRRSIRPVP